VNFQHNQVFDTPIIALSKVKRENVTVVLVNKTAPDILERIKLLIYMMPTIEYLGSGKTKRKIDPF
jgi:hypothetical protein